MPPRSLIGTLFGAAAALWALLLGVLLSMLAPGGGTGAGFWAGVVLAGASGFGWGAWGGQWLARGVPTGRRTAAQAAGLLRFGAGGVVLLLLAGTTTLAAGLVLTALGAGAGATWDLVRHALARPGALLVPALGVVFIGVPLGAAAGVVLRALATPPGDAPGSRRPPSR